MTLALIKTETLVSNTNSISFTSIPSTYKDLYLLYNLRGTDAATRVPLYMTFNNNSSAIYSGVRGYAFESGLATDSGTTYTYIPLSSINAAGVSSNIFSPGEVYIFDYANGAMTTGKSITMASNSASSAFVSSAGQFGWDSTAVVSSIQLFPAPGNNDLLAGSTASLYGIK